MKNILIIGATSAIAQETARAYAKDGDRLILVARDPARLETLAADLKSRGASETHTIALDVLEMDRHDAVIEEAWNTWNGIDIALVAHGTLGDQTACENDYALAEYEFKTNFLSVVSLLTPLANKMQEKKAGTIGVISSVAGLRGRLSNYIYGAAKGGLNIYLQGLRNRLAHHGVAVVTILPGFVDTPMTADIPKGPLFASAETVGRGIYKAMNRQKNIVYLPWFWWGIMTIIRCIPEPIFKKLKL
ncbi:MAG: decaprenylphospho-beta-D-erythro-pentofuranosid-2-ulose 2-reductase [Kiritimatiellia bacterium]|jgi:decaprenylphospho-beta-D-erythro-pentofuranosid-2-ulose 2-reductase